MDKAVSLAAAFGFELVLPSNGNEVEDLVVIAGWWGARVKTLKKYSDLVREIWPKAACLLVIASSRVSNMFSSYEGIAHDVSRVLDDVTVEKPDLRVWLYYFSNGGFLLHGEMCKYFQRVDAPDLRGIIFDSCPAHPTPITATKAVNNGKFSWPIYCCLGPVIWFAEKRGRLRRFLVEAKTLAPGVPELYLYGKLDEITLVEVVESVTKARKEFVTEIQTECFEESTHCAHYKNYPERYSSVLERFLRQYANN